MHNNLQIYSMNQTTSSGHGREISYKLIYIHKNKQSASLHTTYNMNSTTRNGLGREASDPRPHPQTNLHTQNQSKCLIHTCYTLNQSTSSGLGWEASDSRPHTQTSLHTQNQAKCLIHTLVLEHIKEALDPRPLFLALTYALNKIHCPSPQLQTFISSTCGLWIELSTTVSSSTFHLDADRHLTCPIWANIGEVMPV